MGNAGQTAATQAYRLLHAGMAQAVADELIAANPCAIKGAGQRDAHDRVDRRTVSLEEMWALADGMPERYRASVILAICLLDAWVVSTKPEASIDCVQGWLP